MYDAKKRLCSLIDSELCHLADHEINVCKPSSEDIVLRIINLLNTIYYQVIKDTVDTNEQRWIDFLVELIKDSVLRKDVSVLSNAYTAKIVKDPRCEKSYLDICNEIRDLLGNLEFEDKAMESATRRWLNELSRILWKYSA